MRRFSQRGHLVTLSEINITPLLDLAFVLLIIFVITTPLLEQSIDLKLPRGGRPDQAIARRNVRTVEISATGIYTLDRRRMALPEIAAQLAAEFRRNSALIVYIRADADGPYKNVAALLNDCQQYGITRYSLRTEPPK
ncbi:MAG: biopolymer transporter ExbD [Verrucomicrobia bacterium]|nr:biopolymer transporter ExbD [Verrucomicrobiota bacterium]MDE3100361.1 biopolymer transporter ExbD [Verrucomicrobiota bacterium]